MSSVWRQSQTKYFYESRTRQGILNEWEHNLVRYRKQQMYFYNVIRYAISCKFLLISIIRFTKQNIKCFYHSIMKMFPNFGLFFLYWRFWFSCKELKTVMIVLLFKFILNTLQVWTSKQKWFTKINKAETFWVIKLLSKIFLFV